MTKEPSPVPAAAAGAPRNRFLPQSAAQWVIGLTAFAFFAGAIGYFVGTREDAAPAADSADVGFLYAMSAHHQQALELSQVLLVNGSDPAVATIAREIIRDQSYEIGLMTMRLDTWGEDAFSVPQSPMGWMGLDGSTDSMPGMATADEVAALRAADGADADALFIALMQDHHRGGIAMAEAAAAAADDTWVVNSAAAMAHNQGLEIQEMDLLRDTLGLSARPPGFSADEPMEMNADGASESDGHGQHGG